MNKYFTRWTLVGLIVITLLFSGLLSSAKVVQAESTSFCQMIDLLVSLGVIPAENLSKVQAVRLSYNCSTPVTPVTDNSNNTYGKLKATIITAPVMTLSYDSRQRESLLTATFKGQIKSDMTDESAYLRLDPFSVSLNRKSDGSSYKAKSHNITTSITNSNGSALQIDKDANIFYYLIPKNTTVFFEVTLTARPAELFSGAYYAKIGSAWLSNTEQTIEINQNDNLVTNTVTIVGETSPYITSVASPITLDNNSGMRVIIKGTRFSPTNNSIMIGTKEFPGFASKNNGTLLDLYLSGSGISTEGYQTLYVTNSDMGNEAGRSNSFSVQIISTDVITPAIDNVTISTSETYPGDKVIIKWDETNTKDTVNIYLNRLINNQWIKQLTIGSIKPVGNGRGRITWNVPTDLKVFDSKYQIYVETIGAGGMIPVIIREVTPVTQPSITVLSPNGGEVLQEGQNHIIKWSSKDIPETAKIIVDVFEYTGNDDLFGGANHQLAVLSPTINSYTWKVAGNDGYWGFGLKNFQQKVAKLFGIRTAQAAGGQHKISVRAYDYATNSNVADDSSDSSFTITIPVIKPVITSVASMAAGDSEVDAGGKFAIVGTNLVSAGKDAFVYFVHAEGGQKFYASITQYSSTLLYAMAPTNLSAGGTYRLYVSNSLGISNPVMVKVINSVVTQPSITITSPNGEESLTLGQIHTIKWNATENIDKVSIGYSFGQGSLNWIANNIPNTGYYDWIVKIGNTINAKAKIYIIGYQTGVGSVTDYSDEYFDIITSSTTSSANQDYAASLISFETVLKLLQALR